MADHTRESDADLLPVAEARDHCGDPARSLRPRMALVGMSVGEVITSAGGWMFDHAMGGWDAYVAARDLKGARALRILGARCVDLDATLVAPGPGPWPQMLAVSAELYRVDRRVRDGVWETLNRCGTTLTMWGPDCPVELEPRVHTTLYRISAAAGAFKPHALAAVGAAPTADTSVELLHTARLSVLSLARN